MEKKEDGKSTNTVEGILKEKRGRRLNYVTAKRL
jgi:hypothetical protein